MDVMKVSTLRVVSVEKGEIQNKVYSWLDSHKQNDAALKSNEQNTKKIFLGFRKARFCESFDNNY